MNTQHAHYEYLLGWVAHGICTRLRGGQLRMPDNPVCVGCLAPLEPGALSLLCDRHRAAMTEGEAARMRRLAETASMYPTMAQAEAFEVEATGIVRKIMEREQVHG
jgi:hypothetical protein